MLALNTSKRRLWLGLGAVVVGISCATWWTAVVAYEDRVAELHAHIARRGWPTTREQILAANTAAPRPVELMQALERLRERAGDPSADIAQPYRALLLCRGQATAQRVRWNDELERAAAVLDSREFDAWLAALSALPALAVRCEIDFDTRGFAHSELRFGTLVTGVRLVRVHAERALAARRIDEAARDAQRLLDLAQWLGAEPLAGAFALAARREGLCVLRDVLDDAVPDDARDRCGLAAPRVEALLATLERAEPELEQARWLDSERVLRTEPLWELVAATESDLWARERSGIRLETSWLGRPFRARAEALALADWIELRAHVERTPCAPRSEGERRAWPLLAELVAPRDSMFVLGRADERRALDLARIALARLDPRAPDAPRDPLTQATYTTEVQDGAARVRAESQFVPRHCGWPLDWRTSG